MTSTSECCHCHVDVKVGMQIATKNPHTGKWDVWRYCGPCAQYLGELDDARTMKAIATAERSGV